MDATAALRNLELSDLHETMKAGVLAKASSFEKERGYRPPYWELVRMANETRKESKKDAR
jgi:hypothetical protein